MQLGGRPRQVLGVLQAVVYAILIHVGEAVPLLPGRLNQLLTELHALLWRHLREDVLGRLLVDVGGKVRSHLTVAIRRLLVRDRPGALLITLDEFLVVSLRATE